MFVNKGYYKTSNDYKKLFELLCEGHTIVCLIADYDCGVKTDKKQICKANRWREFDISFNTPGIGYLDINPSDKEYFGKPEFELFETQCKQQDVEWILSETKKIDACDKNLCKNYNKLYNRCKFLGGYCHLKTSSNSRQPEKLLLP